MFYFLVFAAILFFVAHVVLLVASFNNMGLVSSRYFYSHLTLWLTGVIIFILALLFAGSSQSGFLDYFDTPLKKGMILIATFALSLVAHGIVKLLVLPLIVRKK